MKWSTVIWIDTAVSAFLLFAILVPLVPRKVRHRPVIEYRYFGALSILAAVFSALGVLWLGQRLQHDPSAHCTTEKLIESVLLSAASTPLVFSLIYGSFVAAFVIVHKPVQIKGTSPFYYVDHEKYPMIDVILPCRNEPFDVERMTLDSALAQYYPADKLRITIVDNSNTDMPDYKKWYRYVQYLHKVGSRFPVRFLHRDGTEGFKPRNLDMGLETMDSDFVLFLDVDSTLAPDTLLRLLGEIYRDPKIAFVQPYLVSTNRSTGALAKVGAWGLGFWRYRECMRGAHGGWPLFVGHNALWRRSALRDVGEFLEDHRGEVVVAEDVSMTMRAYKHGYYGMYVWHPTGEWAPGSLEDLESMWARWAYGMLQVMMKYKRLVFGWARSEMTLTERVDVMQHAMGYVALAFMPVWMILAFLTPSTNYQAIMGVAITTPWITQFLGYVTNRNLRKQYGPDRGAHQFFLAMFVIEPFIMWVKCKAIWRYFFRSSQGWKPTGKSATEPTSWLSVIRKRWDSLLFSSAILGWFAYDLAHGMTTSMLMARVPAIAVALGMFCTVLFYGRSSLEAVHGKPHGASILELSELAPDLPIYKTHRAQRARSPHRAPRNRPMPRRSSAGRKRSSH